MRATIRRRWQALCRAARVDGLPGVWRLGMRTLRVMLAWPIRRAQTAQRALEAERYPAWLAARRPDAAEQARERARCFSHRLSILIPTWNTDPACLFALADSLLAQTASAWEAVFCDGASTRPETLAALRQIGQRDARLRVEFSRENGGIAGNTNRAAEAATGDYVALCDHDDLLEADAVYHVLAAAEAGADFIYTDEDKCDETGSRFYEPHFKPDFAPDSLRSGNYICHLMAMSAALFHAVGGLRSACDGSQDHDLALRATEQAKQICHIRRVLYHWRMLDTSFSHQRMEKCVDAAVRAVNDQLTRLHLPGQAENYQMTVRIRWPQTEGRIALVVLPGNGRPLPWLRTLLRHTTQPVCEAWLTTPVGASTVGKTAIRQAQDPLEAVRLTDADAVLFLREGLLPRDDGWLDALWRWASRPETACVGAPIVDRRGRYITDGLAVEKGELISCYAGEYSLGPTWQLADRITRNVTAVSENALLIRRETLLSLSPTAVSGAAWGIAALRQGLYNVVVPEGLLSAGRPLAESLSPSEEEDEPDRYWRVAYQRISAHLD